MGNSSPVFITMIIYYNKTWVKQDAFNCFQAEGNTHNNTEVLLSGFSQQLVERSHTAENISKRLQKTPFPHSPSFDQHVSKCYRNSIVEGTLLWNSTIQFSTWGGGGCSLAIACIQFWTSSVNLSWGKTSVTNPQSLASTAVSLHLESNISLD